jgi:hypothetical protein
MVMPFRSFVVAEIALLVLFACPFATAQVPPPQRITLYAAAAPKPPLKYRLLPAYADRIPGNAAVYYGKVKAEQNRFFGDAGLRQKIEMWQNAPLETLRDPEVRVPLDDYFLEQGALCDHCDWQFPIGREPLFGVLLPEAQESRSFGRILGAKARIEIARGEFDAAVKHLRLSYALARHVSAGEFLVTKLVGVAIGMITSTQTLEFIQQPGAPNLYWSLSELPRPMFDFRDAVLIEADVWAMSFPELRDPAKIERSAEQWRTTLVNLWTVVADATDDEDDKRPAEELVDACLANISEAFARLIDMGWTKDQLMAMPAEQVVALDLMMIHRGFADEAAVAFFLPYPEASQQLKAIQERATGFREQSAEGAALPLITIGPLIGCRAALARSERDFAFLRVLEALRLHADSAGKLPQKLDEITEVVVPHDPSTGEPFRYVLDGDVARISSETLNDVIAEYEIRLGVAPR